MSKIGSPTFPYNSPQQQQPSSSNSRTKGSLVNATTENQKKIQKHQKINFKTFEKEVALLSQHGRKECEKTDNAGKLSPHETFPGVKNIAERSGLTKSSQLPGKAYFQACDWPTEKTVL